MRYLVEDDFTMKKRLTVLFTAVSMILSMFTSVPALADEIETEIEVEEGMEIIAGSDATEEPTTKLTDAVDPNGVMFWKWSIRILSVSTTKSKISEVTFNNIPDGAEDVEIAFYVSDDDNNLIDIVKKSSTSITNTGSAKATVTVQAKKNQNGTGHIAAVLTYVLDGAEYTIDAAVDLEVNVSASIVSSGECGDDLTWTLDNTGTLTISGTGAMTEWDWGGAPWYSKANSITKVIIENGVTNIGSYAFSWCSGMTDINIPESVVSIGEWAFTSCRSLTELRLPDGITKIENHTFESCDGLTSINIPESVTIIEDYAFSACRSLTDIKIPDGVTNIGSFAFYNCMNLTDINIPNGVTIIENSAFSSCISLTGIVLPDGVTSIGDEAFRRCGKLVTINIPDGVTSIGYRAFEDCSSLESINIPDGVTSIEDDTFEGCRSLTSLKLPESVTSIGKYAFSYCTALTDISLPDSVESIGDWAFYGCSGLKEIIIPDGVTYIYYRTFSGCDSLTGVSIPDSVKGIGNYAFYDCPALESISIPGSVERIEPEAFSGNLSDVYYSGTEEKWNEIEISDNNSDLLNAAIHYCMESDIVIHYADGTVTFEGNTPVRPGAVLIHAIYTSEGRLDRTDIYPVTGVSDIITIEADFAPETSELMLWNGTEKMKPLVYGVTI